MLGLGFGDCGKGLFVDALTRRWRAHSVVRFSGGAQAGHNVLTGAPSDPKSRHHTFSQFGSGTFVAGTRTVLADPMIVHPTALIVEAEALASKGISDALSRLSVDATCRITTPFHQAAGRLRELLRGADAHGTCGVGVGETVRHSIEYPDQTLRYGDLANAGKGTFDRLHAIRQTLLEELEPRCDGTHDDALTSELSVLRSESIAKDWLNAARALARHCPAASTETIHGLLTEPGCVVFEGAQGILLDEWRGFHPHTTWSSITTDAVESVAMRFGIEEPIEHLGALRTYVTRHGEGPLPTHDPMLDKLLPEPHNHEEGWQGQFRRGNPDAVLLRYAIKAIGNLSGLLISHLDVFGRGIALRWCEAYNTGANLPISTENDLTHQSELTRQLCESRPVYAHSRITSEEMFLQHMQGVTALPIRLVSRGNTADSAKDL